jgi:hypothetical protein
MRAGDAMAASEAKSEPVFAVFQRGYCPMKPELCDYMCGHESKSGTAARYGKRKVPVLAKEMALFPRFKVPALSKPLAPHKRSRRTRAQLDRAAKAVRQAKRADQSVDQGIEPGSGLLS